MVGAEQAVENILNLMTNWIPLHAAAGKTYLTLAVIDHLTKPKICNNNQKEFDMFDSLYSSFNEHDEARFIAECLNDWVKTGGLRSEAAILYRSNAQSRVLEEALLRSQIPYRIYGGQKFYERQEIRNALAYLRLVINRNDDAAFERAVNTPTRGIGDKTVQALRQLARDKSITMWAAADKAVMEKRFSSRASSAVQSFMILVHRLDEDATGLALPEQVDSTILGSGLIDFHRQEKGDRGQSRVENLQELVVACRSFEPEDKEQPSLKKSMKLLR